jgi:aminoglycoside phosphotransferase (APT) family kinase protein
MLNEKTLREFLRDRLPGADLPLSVEPLRGGQSNPTFRLRFGSRSYVLRKRPEGVLLPSAHAVDREYRVISALAKTDVPVPRTYCYCDDAGVIGTPFFVMDYVEGRVFRDPALPELDMRERAALWDEINSVIARLHGVDYAAAGLSDYGKPGNYFERQIGRWTKQYRASETERIESMDRLVEWLPENIPPAEDTSIVHGDFRIDNLIWNHDTPRIAAIVDWELSTLGHPFADIAYFSMALRLPRNPVLPGLAGSDRAALGIPEEGALVERFAAATGLDPLPHWNFLLAFQFFRLAAIAQGVLKRALQGNASNEQALAAGRMTRTIATLGAEQIVNSAPG